MHVSDMASHLQHARLSEDEIKNYVHSKKIWLDGFNKQRRPVFCQCLQCAKVPLLRRTAVIDVSTARKHNNRDVQNSAPEQRRQLESKQWHISLDAFLTLYEGWLRGSHNEYGALQAGPSGVQGSHRDPESVALRPHTMSGVAGPSRALDHSAAQPHLQDHGAPDHDDHVHEAPDDPWEAHLADSPGDQDAIRYIRPNAVYSSEHLVGRWAEYYDGRGCRRPTSEELEGRLPGRDGSERTRARINEETGTFTVLFDYKIPL